jgi:hypothetical protein
VWSACRTASATCRPGVRLSVANQVAGASANDVTDAELTDTVAGTAAVNGVPVTVTAC